MELICVNDVMDSNPLHERGPFAEGYDLGAAYSSVTGEYVNIAEATVPMVDMGFMHADAAYDVVTVSRGNFFRLEEHLERMEKSCAKFELKTRIHANRPARSSRRWSPNPASKMRMSGGR